MPTGYKEFRDRSNKKGDWETLDVNADNRLPASHRFLFLVNSLLLSAAVVYLYSEIFDMNIEENVVIFGAVSVVSAVMLTMACQSRAKKLIARLISKRGIELQSSIRLKTAGKDEDEKTKAKAKAAEKQRSEIDNEALALSLSSTNAFFLFFLVLIAFTGLRSSSPSVNYIGSTLCSGVLALYTASRAK
eukprot:Tamp_24566.p2 GENE.Tamp_24566~~Tamp_24566.p2  ORF type:complete len:210 (+),score=66.54 Tamp_24566:65-631(+)